MYNNESKNSQAWWAKEEFINADNLVTASHDEMEAAADNAVGVIGELEDEVEEAREDAEQAERDQEVLQKRLDAKETVAARRFLEILTSIRDAADRGIIQLRAEFNVAEESTDDSDRDRGDDSAKGDSDEGAPTPAADGVARS